ncbi:MAG: HEPN domain-containing protein [Nitrososphaerales archaeon]
MIESMAFDKKEYERWMKQAEYTMDSAREDMVNLRFSWACFKAQQSAEYALKGLLYGIGSIPVGHSLIRLVGRLKRRGVDISEALRHSRLLDRHYIPTRYPNAHPEGAPFEYYDEETAKEALHSAEAIFGFVREVSKRWQK